jgi:hypothetical protein
MAAIIACLLEQGHCDPNCTTHHGTTPLDLATKTEHFHLLLKFGATLNESNMIKCFPQHFLNQPTDMCVKLFILGNPGAGKSTLVKSLQIEGTVFSRVKHRFTKVTNVDERTAGIIPFDIQCKALGRVTLFDFAGHREFYASHDALLQNSMTASPSVVTLVIDMRGEEGSIRDTLQYWFEFINCHSVEGRSKSHLIILGSHTDCLPSSEVKQKTRFIQLITNHHSLDSISISGHILLDCRYPESSSMSQLRSVLSQSCKALRSSETRAIAHRAFLVFLFHKYPNQSAIKFSVAAAEMIHEIESKEYAYMYLYCLKSSNVFEICETLNNQGEILFMKNDDNPENSWIVFDKTALLSKINGVIFAPEGFKEHQDISTSTGVVLLSKLVSLFPNLDCDMICQLLCHLEFCHEITDPEILALLHAKTDASPLDEKFLFFPGLVDTNISPDLWQPNSQFDYHSGWLLQSIKREQFFSSRFLQVLLLRLAYGLAFAPPDKHPSDCDLHLLALKRSCYVWKCGICWSDRSGVETIVEIVNQKSIVVLTRSLKHIESHTRLTYVRSQIIKRVLGTKEGLCPKVVVKETFLHPEAVISYPLDLTNAKIVNMSEVAHVVVEAKLGVLDSEKQMVNVKNGLLCYEPYFGFGRAILDELFKEDDHGTVEDGFLYDIAKRIVLHENTDYIIKIFKPCPIRLANLLDRAPPGDVHRLVRVFQLWREEMGAEATRYNLCKRLGQFSIFAGRNPLSLCMTLC